MSTLTALELTSNFLNRRKLPTRTDLHELCNALKSTNDMERLQVYSRCLETKNIQRGETLLKVLVERALIPDLDVEQAYYFDTLPEWAKSILRPTSKL